MAAQPGEESWLASPRGSLELVVPLALLVPRAEPGSRSCHWLMVPLAALGGGRPGGHGRELARCHCLCLAQKSPPLGGAGEWCVHSHTMFATFGLQAIRPTRPPSP